MLTNRFAATVWKTVIQSFTEPMATVTKILKHFNSVPRELKLFNF